MKLANGKRSQLLEYLMIIAGTGLMALAINSVFDASGMVTGGFSGVSIIVKAWTKGIVYGGIPLWVTNFGLNIPLFLIGWRIRGFSFVSKGNPGRSFHFPPGLRSSRSGIWREMTFFSRPCTAA